MTTTLASSPNGPLRLGHGGGKHSTGDGALELSGWTRLAQKHASNRVKTANGE